MTPFTCTRCLKEHIGECRDVKDLEQRLEYALRNLNITEKARQEEMAKRDELQRQVTELATTIEQLANIGGPNGR